MTGNVRHTDFVVSDAMTRMSPIYGIACSTTAIPETIDDVKLQIEISEKQIGEGKYITASEAIAHFSQL